MPVQFLWRGILIISTQSDFCLWCSTVGRWLALLPHISCIWIHCGVFSVDILHVLPRNSSLFPQFKDMHGVRLIGDTKLGVGVSPVTNWWPVLAVLGLSSYESWDRLQPTCNSEFDKQEKVDGWIDGWMGWPMLGSIGINLLLQLASSCYLSKHIFFSLSVLRYIQGTSTWHKHWHE